MAIRMKSSLLFLRPVAAAALGVQVRFLAAAATASSSTSSSFFLLHRRQSSTSAAFTTTFTTRRAITRTNRPGRRLLLQHHHQQQLPSSSSARMAATTSSADVIEQQDTTKLMQDILYRVRDTNHMPLDVRQSLIEFRLDNELLGKTCPKTAELLCKTKKGSDNNDSSVFVMSSEGYLTLSEDVVVAGNDCESRTKAVGNVMESLRDDEVIGGWRDELLPVVTGFYDPEPKFLIERAAAPLLATTEYGVHINGIVYGGDESDESDDNNIRMWIGRRSKTKSKYPGMLDHIVAGGQPSGISLIDNVLKECMEEAGIPEDVVRQGLKSAGAVSYETYNPPNSNYPNVETITRSVLFCYDLVLPRDFQPKPVDGEVDEFMLMSIHDEVLQATMSPSNPDPIKPNCYLVIIDFLIRHGYLNPDVPGYLDVLRELRSGDCR